MLKVAVADPIIGEVDRTVVGSIGVLSIRQLGHATLRDVWDHARLGFHVAHQRASAFRRKSDADVKIEDFLVGHLFLHQYQTAPQNSIPAAIPAEKAPTARWDSTSCNHHILT